jgi:predicted amidohydrolase YtcJ
MTRILACMALPIMVAAAFPVVAAAWSAEPDTIITNASIVTMGPQARADAIAIKGNRIVGVGSNAEIAALKGPATRMIDGSGKTIVPGLQDSHIHSANLGHDLKYTVELLRARSGAEVAKLLAEQKVRVNAQPGDWLVGARWDASQFKKLFTRWDIDAATPENPVYLSAYRRLAINTATVKLMGITDDNPTTWPDWWLKDPTDFTAEDTIHRAPRKITVNGKTQTYTVPTGVFIGTEALKRIGVRPPPLSSEDRVESIRLGSYELNKVGLTSIVEPGNGFGTLTKVFQMAHEQNKLSVRVLTYEGTFFQHPVDWINKLLDDVQVSNIGDDWLRLSGTKIYADGGPSARGSWVSQPYLPLHPGDKPDFGVPVEPDWDKREAQFRAIVAHGWDLHTHSTGDQAMLQDVRLYKKLLDEIHVKNPNADLRWSIEHANMPLEQPEVIQTMAKYKIVASIQPVMVSALGNAWKINLGKERMGRQDPAASYMKAGVMVVSGSDYGVTPYDPWLGMYALVTRKDLDTGEVYGPDERIGLMDALKTYTINGAYAAYAEKDRGSLEVGKLADFVVVDMPDLMQAERDPELLRAMSGRVLATVVDGKVRYQKEGVRLFQYLPPSAL